MTGFPQRFNLPGGEGDWRGGDSQVSQQSDYALRALVDQLRRRLNRIGEYVESSAAADSIGSWSSNTPKDIVSTTLTPGDYEVFAEGEFGGGAITGTNTLFSISTTSATIQSPGLFETPSVPTATTNIRGSSGRRILVLVDTPIYLVGRIVFSGGTPTAGGIIRARWMGPATR